MGLQFESWMLYLNLQVGVMFAGASFITLGFNIIVVNAMLMPEKNRWAFNVGITMFAVAIMVIWFMAFLGAYLQKKNIILFAMIGWSFFILSWIFVVLLSTFTEAYGKKFCVHNRCSISMWLFTNRLSRIFYDKFDYWYHDDHDIPGDRPVHDPFDSLDPFSDPLTEAKKHRRELKYFLAVVLFILSFVMSFVYLVASWILLHSYYFELKCQEMLKPCVNTCKSKDTETRV